MNRSVTASPSPTSVDVIGKNSNVNPILSRYLTRRKFPHSVHRTGATGPTSISSYALRNLVMESETSTNDAVQFSSSISDPIIIEQQYAKFKIWISESPDSFKPELAQLLYPTFTHLYLELVLSGQKLSAQKFHKRHQSTFLGNAEFASFIRQLTPILTPEDIVRDETVRAFHSAKYTVTLSNKTFHFLMRYLQTCGQPVLLHILRGKVDLKLADALGASSKAESIRRMESEKCGEVGKIEVDSKSTEASQNMIDSSSSSINVDSKFSESLKRLGSDLRTPLPSSCVYRLQHPSSNFTSSTISKSITNLKLAAGAENGSIYVWNLMPVLEDDSTKGTFSINAGHSGHLNHFSSNNCDNDLHDPNGAIENENDEEEKSESDLCRLIGHIGSVYDVAFSKVSNGHILSVGEDTTMRIWDLQRKENVAVYRGHSYPIWSIDIDRMGIHVATGSMDKTAKLWHLEYTYPIRMYAGHEHDVDVVRFHPNCNYLATGSVDKTVRLWSHADGKMVRVFPGHKGAIFAVSFSPDGKKLASAGEDRRVKIWDLNAASCLQDFKGHSDTIYSLTWNSDSSLLASAGIDGTVRFWDVSSSGNSESQSTSFTTGCSCVTDLRYSIHNTLLVTGIAGLGQPPKSIKENDPLSSVLNGGQKR